MHSGGKRQLLECGLCVHRWVLQADACCCFSTLATVRCCCSTQSAVVQLFLFEHFNTVQCLTFGCSRGRGGEHVYAHACSHPRALACPPEAQSCLCTCLHVSIYTFSHMPSTHVCRHAWSTGGSRVPSDAATCVACTV